MKPGVQAPGFDFTAYLKWNRFEDEPNFLGLDGVIPEPMRAVVAADQEKFREYQNAEQRTRGMPYKAHWIVAEEIWIFREEYASRRIRSLIRSRTL